MESSSHRFLALIAAGLAVMAFAMLGLRDTVLVPMLTGNPPGAWMILDGFWTPLLNWIATGAFGVGLLLAGAAVVAWQRGLIRRGLRPRQVALGLVGLMALLGIVVGLVAALAN